MKKIQGLFEKKCAAGEGSGKVCNWGGGGGGQQTTENSFGIQHCNIAIFWPDCILSLQNVKDTASPNPYWGLEAAWHKGMDLFFCYTERREELYPG